MISERVLAHRSHLMLKMETRSLSELARLADKLKLVRANRQAP
jgi:FixJ family two-component response regulator